VARDFAQQAEDLERLADELREHQRRFEQDVDEGLRDKQEAMDEQLAGPLTRLRKISEKQ
jgi:hypothetical protein